MKKMNRERIIATVPCQRCDADVGEPCRTIMGINGEYTLVREQVHIARLQDFQRAVNPKLEQRQNKRAAKRAKAERERREMLAKAMNPKDFYASWEWKEARYAALKAHGRRCLCCGWSPDKGGDNFLVVDHIKPLRLHPELALDPENHQVICNDCNMGKSYRHEDDFRP